MKHIVLQILLDFPCTPYVHVETFKRRDEILQYINATPHLQILPRIDQIGGEIHTCKLWKKMHLHVSYPENHWKHQCKLDLIFSKVSYWWATPNINVWIPRIFCQGRVEKCPTRQGGNLMWGFSLESLYSCKRSTTYLPPHPKLHWALSREDKQSEEILYNR